MNATDRANFTDFESMDMEIIKLFKLGEAQVVVQQWVWFVITCCFWLPAFFVNSLLIHLARTRVSLHSVPGMIATNMAAAYNVMLVSTIPQLFLPFVNIPTFVIYLSHSSVVLVTTVIVPTTIVIHALERQSFICNALRYSAPFWWTVVLTTLILSWITTVFTTIFFVTERTWVPSQTLQQIISVTLCFVAFIICFVCHARIGIKSFEFLTLSEHSSCSEYQKGHWKNDSSAPVALDIASIPKFSDIVSPGRESFAGSTLSNMPENEHKPAGNDSKEVNLEASSDSKQVLSTTITSKFTIDSDSAEDDGFRERRSSLFYQKPTQVSMRSTLPGFVQDGSDVVDDYLKSSLGTNWDLEETTNELSLSIAGILSKNKHFPTCSALSDLMNSLDLSGSGGLSNKKAKETKDCEKNVSKRRWTSSIENLSSSYHSTVRMPIPRLLQPICKPKHSITEKIRELGLQQYNRAASKLVFFGTSAKATSHQTEIQSGPTTVKTKSISQSIGESVSYSCVNGSHMELTNSFDGIDNLDVVDTSAVTTNKSPETGGGKRQRRVKSISAWIENDEEEDGETGAHSTFIPDSVSNPVMTMVGMDDSLNQCDQADVTDDAMAQSSVDMMNETSPKQAPPKKEEDCPDISKESPSNPPDADSPSCEQDFDEDVIGLNPPDLGGIDHEMLDSSESEWLRSSKINNNKANSIQHGHENSLRETGMFSMHHGQEQETTLNSFGGSFLSFADMLNQSQFSGISIFLERNDSDIRKTDLDMNTKKKLIFLKTTSPPLFVTFYFFSLIPILFALTHESKHVMDSVNLNKSILALLHPLVYVLLDADFREALATLLFNLLRIRRTRWYLQHMTDSWDFILWCVCHT